MQREHQDPAEAMSQQLLQYLIQKCDIKRKFNNAFKHGLLSAKGLMYVGVLNGEPEVWNVNSLRFNGDKSPDSPFVEDGEYASCEYLMTPSDIIKYFVANNWSEALAVKYYDTYAATNWTHNGEKIKSWQAFAKGFIDKQPSQPQTTSTYRGIEPPLIVASEARLAVHASHTVVIFVMERWLGAQPKD